MTSKITIVEQFQEIDEPRIERSKKHLLIDIFTIAILAVIYSADAWICIETYGRAKYQWLKNLSYFWI